MGSELKMSPLPCMVGVVVVDILLPLRVPSDADENMFFTFYGERPIRYPRSVH